MKLRLIIQSSENGENECVHFTDKFDDPIEDLTIPGYDIDFDGIIDAELPSIFPLGYELQRR